MKIIEITDESIIFEDKSCITFDHDQDCCEYNYADFNQLDDLARSHDYKFPLKFEAIEDSGFKFGDDSFMAFVPCYSEQNGYYSADVDIYYKGQIVLTFNAEERDY